MEISEQNSADFVKYKSKMNKKPKTLNEESNEEPVDIEDYYGYTKKPKLKNGG